MSSEMKMQLLFKFMQEYPTFAHRMRSTLHSYDDQKASPWHLEDDCWSHTMLVFNALDLDGMDPANTVCVLLAGLVHDAGKPLTRKSHKPGKVNFWGHAEAGTQFAAEACEKMVGQSTRFNRVVHLVTHAVSHHIDAYHVPSEKLQKYINYDYDMMDIMTRVMEADLKGQLSIGRDDESIKSTDKLEEFRQCTGEYEESPYVEEPDVMLYCGIPGCGKDHLAKKDGRVIYSFDKLRMEWLEENVSEEEIEKSGKPPYTLAFEKTKKVNLNDLLKKKLEAAKENGESVAICNTMCPSKSRKKMVKLVKSVYGKESTVGCKFIFTWLDQAISNDRDRSEKTVGEEVIRSFANAQKVPNMAEGFDKLVVLFNTYKPVRRV